MVMCSIAETTGACSPVLGFRSALLTISRPVCPQGDLDGERAWFALPDGMENRPLELEVQDEFRCLNLIITRPTNVVTHANFPVLVYIHGGFFSLGTANKKAEG